MQGHFWHLFVTQFLMRFDMVPSVLLSMVAFSTIFWLVEILQQPIRIIEISRYWSCHGEESACYHVKEHHKKLGQKLVSKVTLHFVWGHSPKKQTVAGLWHCLSSLATWICIHQSTQMFLNNHILDQSPLWCLNIDIESLKFFWGALIQMLI